MTKTKAKVRGGGQQPKPSGVKLVLASKMPQASPLELEPIPHVVDPGYMPALVGGGYVLKQSSQRAKAQQPFLIRTFNNFTMSCECGTTYNNNCAHFLTNAMVKAGLPKPFPGNYAKCPKGRLIRAKECLDWFRSFSTGSATHHEAITSGVWFVYQESQGQGHVLVHEEFPNSYNWRGTTNLPSWPVQWHYYY